MSGELRELTELEKRLRELRLRNIKNEEEIDKIDGEKSLEEQIKTLKKDSSLYLWGRHI